MIATIAIFIVILGLLVFVHELGHFTVAKKSGMAVEEFGFGFPPRLIGFQKINGRTTWVFGNKKQRHPDEVYAFPGKGSPGKSEALTGPDLLAEQTIYSVNWIPLGGFVKIRGENNDFEDDPKSFINRPFFGRLLTLVAGVLMNLILAWALISIGFIIGLPAAVDSAGSVAPYATLKNARIGIVDVVQNFPADRAGIRPGDVIVKVDGRNFSDIGQVSAYVAAKAGMKIDFEIQRDGQNLNFQVQSQKPTSPNEGPTGIALANIGTLTVPWYWAFWEGAKATGVQISNIFHGFYLLLTAKLGWGSVGGPIKIYQLTGEVAQMGFIYVLQFTAFLSLNLAILNILPFPALDGGRVLFLIIEKLRRKRNNQAVEQWVNTVGFILLLLLMAAVTVKDIIKR